MRLVIQRVDEAFTTLNGVIENRISTGLLIFVAVEDKDTFKEVHKMALKVLKLRIFNDSNSNQQHATRTQRVPFFAVGDICPGSPSKSWSHLCI